MEEEDDDDVCNLDVLSPDVDECAPPSAPCMHHCSNTAGSYYCHCSDGFRLEGKSVCVATGEDTLFFYSCIVKMSMGLFSHLEGILFLNLMFEELKKKVKYKHQDAHVGSKMLFYIQEMEE